MESRKILVTGAAGFIGSKLTLRLAESGVKVRALYHAKTNLNLQHENIELVQGNIPYPNSAKVINPDTTKVLVEWKMPMFFVWE